MKAVNLSAFVPADTIEYEIVSADGSTGTGWKITLAHASDPAAQEWSNTKARQRIARSAEIEAAQLNGRPVPAQQRSVEEVHQDNIDWLRSRIKGWSDVAIDFIGGQEPIPFSTENVGRVFGHPKMAWALAQLVKVLANDDAFTRRVEKP